MSYIAEESLSNSRFMDRMPTHYPKIFNGMQQMVKDERVKPEKLPCCKRIMLAVFNFFTCSQYQNYGFKKALKEGKVNLAISFINNGATNYKSLALYNKFAKEKNGIAQYFMFWQLSRAEKDQAAQDLLTYR